MIVIMTIIFLGICGLIWVAFNVNRSNKHKDLVLQDGIYIGGLYCEKTDNPFERMWYKTLRVQDGYVEYEAWVGSSSDFSWVSNVVESDRIDDFLKVNEFYTNDKEDVKI